jgi:bifunctional non-homologous end joining protein LigD
MLAVKEAGRVRFVSRVGRDHTKRFRQIADALTAFKPDTFMLDGEVVIFDQDLVSRFEWLRRINHGELATPPMLMVFDPLQLGDKDYRPEPLKVRRKALVRLVNGPDAHPPSKAAEP